MALIPALTTRLGRSFFLPAHGRGRALPVAFRRLLRGRAGIWDLPELPQIGGPLEPEGAVAESQKRSAAAMGVQHAWYGVNGATGLLQAALLAVAAPGQAVLMPRNVHRSLIQACLLGDITPVLFDLPFQVDRGQPAPPDRPWLDRIVQSCAASGRPIAAAVLLHPTYQGYASDLEPLVQLLQAQGWPVLVDEAHGSHFAAQVDPLLPRSAVQAGADLVVHSLQKSSTGLAQTAVLWLQGNRLEPERVERSLGWLQTTSPSALLLASCEAALQDWQSAAGRERLRLRLCDARALASVLRQRGLPLLDTQDPLRLVLNTAAHGISGLDADDWLLPRGWLAELPEPATLTFCLGFARHRGLDRAFVRMWSRLLDAHPNRAPFPTFEAPPLPLVASPDLALSQAWRAPSRRVHLDDAVDQLSAELLCPYPPGIPLLIPGERVDQDRLAWLQRQQGLWGEQLPDHVRVVASDGSMRATADHG
ncbi:MAG: lysine decarboxylase [Synechococcus sp.]